MTDETIEFNEDKWGNKETEPVKQYNIGQTLEFIKDEWGGLIDRCEGRKLREGEQVITMEIKDVKTVMLTLGYPVRNIYEE